MEQIQEDKGKVWFGRGMRDGIPIGMGYFAVSLTLGIAAKKAGFSALQASVMSATMLASAGQFAAIQLITSGAGFVEMVMTQIVVNLPVLPPDAAGQRPVPEGPQGQALFSPVSYGLRGDG